MKFIVIFLIFAANVLLAQTPFICKGQYYLSLSVSLNSESGLFEVVLAPNGLSVIFDPISEGIGANMNAIGYRSTDNLIYGIDPDEHFLYKLGFDGKVVELGIPRGIPRDNAYYAGDISPDGKYLMLLGVAADGFNDKIVLVDLDDPAYKVEVRQFQGLAQIYDIAFDPFTSEVYGFSGIGRKLMKIDLETGEVISNYKTHHNVSHIGALFFDTYGNLFGYGSVSKSTQSLLIQFNKDTGKGEQIAAGPESRGNDGCSCPYTVSLLKTVSTPEALPCTSIQYDFIISNNSGIPREGIQFLDEMPPSFSILGVVKNPYEGDVRLTDHSIIIEDMVLHQGIDTISILVEVGEDALGTYSNQAILTGLPTFLGESTLSDNPKTVQESDSTSINILPFDVSFIETYQTICENESVTVDATLYGVEYEWSNGSFDAIQVFSQAGKYTVTVSTDCEQTVVDITIDTIGSSVNILESEIEIILGDQVQLHAKVSPSSDGIQIDWTNDDRSSMSCLDCLSPYVKPYFDTVYNIHIVDEFGCESYDRVSVNVIKDRDIYAPTIFTPNYDGFNDWFTIFTKNEKSLVELSIYDRWGNQVYHRKNIDDNVLSEGWDGQLNGKSVQSGVYTWVALVTFLDDEVILISGDVSIVY